MTNQGCEISLYHFTVISYCYTVKTPKIDFEISNMSYENTMYKQFNNKTNRITCEI